MPNIFPETKEAKNILNLDANVSLNEKENMTNSLFSPIQMTTNNLFFPISSFWNENRLYKSLEGNLIRTPTILQFLDSPLSLVDFLFTLKINLVLRNYKQDYSILRFLKTSK